MPSFLFVLLLILLAGSSSFAPPTTRTITTSVSPHDAACPVLHPQRASVNLAAAAAAEPSLSSSFSSRKDCKVAIIGGGPSGLLLAIFLGQSIRQSNVDVTVWERRSTQKVDNKEQQRAYALGIGRRGRTALKQAGAWEAVKKEGFSSERFDLHLLNVPFLPALRLRDEKDSQGLADVEPSLLMFQSDLCRALAQELEKYNNVKINFDSKVASIDLDKMTVNANDGQTSYGPYDLIVGCDGVNSVVRQAMADRFEKVFESSRELLPGQYKVASGPMPSKLDESAVALLFPRKGSITAFVEPTGNNTACVLFAGSNVSDPLLSSTDTLLLELEILERFPILAGLEKAAAQQLAQRPTAARASKVVCNTYHVPNCNVALVGDAAHATGGVSGQGVNSALVDAQVLAECLLRNNSGTQSKHEMIQAALLEYSIRQVPEGAALYDLSFGPQLESPFKRLQWVVKNLIDAASKGRFLGIGELPLQTKLTTSLQSFADIRRERQMWYDPDKFPSPQEWRDKLTKLHEMMQEANSNQVKL